MADLTSVIYNFHSLCCLNQLFQLIHWIKKGIAPHSAFLTSSHWTVPKCVENVNIKPGKDLCFLHYCYPMHGPVCTNHTEDQKYPFSYTLFQDNYNCGMHDGSQEVSPGWTELHSGDWELWVEGSNGWRSGLSAHRSSCAKIKLAQERWKLLLCDLFFLLSVDFSFDIIV